MDIYTRGPRGRDLGRGEEVPKMKERLLCSSYENGHFGHIYIPAWGTPYEAPQNDLKRGAQLKNPLTPPLFITH